MTHQMISLRMKICGELSKPWARFCRVTDQYCLFGVFLPFSSSICVLVEYNGHVKYIPTLSATKLGEPG